VWRLRIGVAEHRNRPKTLSFSGADNAAGDFAAVGDKDR
jgi:hypothetical protein